MTFLAPFAPLISAGMGLFSALRGSGGGGNTPRPAQSTAQTPAQIEDERRKRLVALNAGAGQGQLTPAGGVAGQATVARKTLLGQ